MNSALKPVLASAGVPQPSGQASPAKGNVASVNHATVGLPQGAQNSLHHASNNLVVQNLTQHAPAPQPPPHAVPSMAPVTPNMAQMAQNMSHHGNLSHVTQNSAAPANLVASPSKGASSSSPLSLVQDKASPSQPLALTCTPEKKEPDSTSQSNGTVDSPKSGSNAPTTLKPQNPETNKDKQDIAKTSPSTPKPPEKPASSPSTPQKPETSNTVSQAEGPAEPKPATANEPSDKSPSKPSESKPVLTADVVPVSDSKPVPEAANDSQSNPPEKPTILAKPDLIPTENPKPEVAKPEEKKEEVVEKPQSTTEEVKAEEKPKSPKKAEVVEKTEKAEEKVEEGKDEVKKPEVKPKSTLKLATVTPPMRKRRQTSPAKGAEGPSPAKKPAEGEVTPSADTRTKRNRTKVQLYQSPTPELTMATKLSASAGRSTPTKPNDDKLIVFYKNEYLAVRNTEGGFYVCQAMQNVYRTTRKIKIRWLSQDKTIDPSGQTYKPDFYDVTDMECVLTTLSLRRAGGGAQELAAEERARALSILQRALRADSAAPPLLTAEHPDGLDLSLYTDESQLDKKSRKRNSSKSSPRGKDSSNETAKDSASPAKKLRTTPKRSQKTTRKSKTPAKQNNKKRISSGSTPPVASTSKTATAVLEKGKVSPKSSPAKRTPAKQTKVEKVETPTIVRKGRRTAAKETKSTPIVATPSTSTGKTGRTPRKLPGKK